MLFRYIERRLLGIFESSNVDQKKGDTGQKSSDRLQAFEHQNGQKQLRIPQS